MLKTQNEFCTLSSLLSLSLESPCTYNYTFKISHQVLLVPPTNKVTTLVLPKKHKSHSNLGRSSLFVWILHQANYTLLFVDHPILFQARPCRHYMRKNLSNTLSTSVLQIYIVSSTQDGTTYTKIRQHLIQVPINCPLRSCKICHSHWMSYPTSDWLNPRFWCRNVTSQQRPRIGRNMVCVHPRVQKFRVGRW